MGGAVVDDPEHAPGGGVGCAGHDLVDEPVEGVDAGGGLAAAEYLGAVHIPGGQVGQGAAAGVFVFDTRRAVWRRWRAGVLADAGLDGGLLIGADDVLVSCQRGVAETAGVQVEHTRGLGSEVGVAGEDPGPVLPGFDRIGGKPAPDGGARDRGDDALVDRGSGQVRAVPACQRNAGFGGQFAGQRFDRDDDVRGKNSGVVLPGVDRPVRAGVARGSVCATWIPLGGACPGGWRSRRCPAPRRRRARS